MRKKALKSKFKITPAIQKNIETIADSLPKFQRKNTDGSLMFRSMSKIMLGSELSEVDRKQIENFDETKKYVKHYPEPVMANHRIALRLTYLGLGQDGVDQYCKFYTDLFDHQTKKDAKEKDKK